MLSVFAYTGLLVFLYMTLLFFIALAKKDNSIVDIGWGIGFILITALTYWMGASNCSRKIVISVLTLLWGLRLSLHIGAKNWGKPEDHRYAAWRKQWGKNVIIRSFLQVFMLQGAVMLVVAYPIILTNVHYQSTLSFLDYLGISVWICGLLFEIIGDRQLYLFLQNPTNKGKIMQNGLWRYTRHPNYFGEATMWWGIFLIALSSPYGYTTIVSPLTITLLLLFVSGVPMAEAMFDNNPAYQAYKKRTSAFFPWFEKKASK